MGRTVKNCTNGGGRGPSRSRNGSLWDGCSRNGHKRWRGIPCGVKYSEHYSRESHRQRCSRAIIFSRLRHTSEINRIYRSYLTIMQIRQKGQNAEEKGRAIGAGRLEVDKDIG